MGETPMQDSVPAYVGTPQRPAPVPARDQERRLRPDELFFSTTDAKGVITAGNRVFSKVACYPLDVLIGRAHNVVRHPDMPRAVFQLLWDELSADRPVAAYVKNLAADGAYYWVLASVVPITGGYLSVRLAPAAEPFAAAKAVYADLVALEREIEGDDVRKRKQSIAASGARLGELLSAAGFADYRAFMQTALLAEVVGRADALAEGHQQALATAPPGSSPFVRGILGSYQLIAGFFGDLIGDLARYANVADALGQHSTYLSRMGEDIQLFALNAQIGASRLGPQGAALDAVARLLTEQSHATSPLVGVVAQQAASVVAEIHEMTFQLALMTIQSEMIAVFAKELADDPDGGRAAGRYIAALTDALSRETDKAVASLNAVSRQLRDVLAHVALIANGLRRLARLSLNGRVELANVPDADAIGALFTDIAQQVDQARDYLGAFDTIQRTSVELTTAANHPAIHEPVRLHERALSFANSTG